MHCAPAGHAPRSVSAPMISQSRCCWGTAVSEITGIAHRSGGRVGDGFALFPPVFPRSSALSEYTQFLRWSGWRRKLSLRREFSPALLAAPATLPLRRSSGCARRWIRWEIKTGDPLSSLAHQIQRPLQCILLPPGTLRGVCPRLWISRSRCCWGTAVSEITGIAHRSGGRVGDGFALFPPVFPRSSALPGRKPKL